MSCLTVSPGVLTLTSYLVISGRFNTFGTPGFVLGLALILMLPVGAKAFNFSTNFPFSSNSSSGL